MNMNEYDHIFNCFYTIIILFFHQSIILTLLNLRVIFLGFKFTRPSYNTTNVQVLWSYNEHGRRNNNSKNERTTETIGTSI